MLPIAAGIILGGVVLAVLLGSFFMWASLDRHDPWWPTLRLATLAAAFTAAAIVVAAGAMMTGAL